MRTEKALGYALLVVGIVFVPMWLAYTINSLVRDLFSAPGTYSMTVLNSSFNGIIFFIIITYSDSIFLRRGFTLIRDVSLKVARESVGEEVMVVKREEVKRHKKGEPKKTSG